jgi:Zn ribbon nucleic-acid-binding protein
MRNWKPPPDLMEKNDRCISDRICPNCKVGLLERHYQYQEKEFKNTVKCRICGFAQQTKETE